VGALGDIYFEKGWYAYVGSAMNGWRSRVGRHLRDDKKLRWHVDYLLRHGKVGSYAVWVGRKKRECVFAGRLSEKAETVKGFGSSDCRCGGHLFYLGNEENRKTLHHLGDIPNLVESPAQGNRRTVPL